MGSRRFLKNSEVTEDIIADKAVSLPKTAGNQIVFNTSGGVVSTLYSSGFLSITRTAVGRFTFVFATAKANTDYVVMPVFNIVGDAVTELRNKTTTGFEVWLSQYAVGYQDPNTPNNCFVNVFDN